jgi:hypothetical protein
MHSAGWPKRYPILQPPNTPVLIAQGFRLAAAFTHGRARTVADVGYNAALSVWAYDELARGVNGYRRALGVVGLFMVARRAGAALAGRRDDRSARRSAPD